MGRKILHGIANRIRGLAEIEVEHSMRVGNHGGVASGQIMLLLSRTAIFLAIQLVTARQG
jgi:hypothetical protein